MADILSMDLDVRPFFGETCSKEHASLLRMIRGFTESQAKQFVGHGITQETYTNEYHPRVDRGYGWDFSVMDVAGDQVVFGEYGGVPDGHVLQLDNGFVTSITDLRQDTSARFASPGGFAASTQLMEGTDFDLERENGSFGKSGRVLKRRGQWSSVPGTIRVTYVAGLTAAQLRGEYLFVKGALLEDMRAKFNFQVAQQQTVGYTGAIRKERYVGDYEVEYDGGGAGGAALLSASVMTDLTPMARAKLQPIRRLKLL